jgi:hypothetical protein
VFIAQLSGEDSRDWIAQNGNLHEITSRVSPNGRYLAFMSNTSLTGYDNTDANSGQRDEEVFLYDAQANRLVCASCNPGGTRPVGVLDPSEAASNEGLLVDPLSHPLWAGRWLAASVPGWTGIDARYAAYQSRYLSNSGRLFFNSAEALVAQDGNGKMDVYQYEPQGVGSCSATSETFNLKTNGCVGLVSSGTSGGESAFLDASESGGDVFFLTLAQLTAQDTDDQFDVYDAHECTKESPCLSPPAVPPAPCSTSTSCKPGVSPQLAISGTPITATFSGPGNTLPAVTSPPSPLTRAQKLAVALKACRSKPKKRRAACELQARRRYGAKSKAKRSKARKRSPVRRGR